MASPLPTPRSAIILGVPFHDVTMDEAFERLAALVERREPVYWATANLDFAFQASRDVELQRILVEADLVLCDGKPLVWASRALGAPLRERVTGSDFVPRLAAEAAARGWRIFLLGGDETSIALALRNLREKHPGLQVDGFSPPFAKLLAMDEKAIEERLRAARPDVLLVAFGCPKQEKWLYMHHRRLGIPMGVGVGATVDFLAGRFSRAPKWMQDIGAEWIYRLAQEPRRLFQRYLFDLLFFVRALRAQRRALADMADTAKAPSPATPPPVQTLPPKVLVVAWAGRADAHAVRSGRLATIEGDIPEGTIVALDLSAVTFLDSSALGSILAAFRKAHARGGGLVLVRPAPAVVALIAAMKLDRLLVTVDDASKAPSALGLVPVAAPGVAARDHELVFPIQGELIASKVPELGPRIEASWAAAPGARILLIDLSAVRFMDSSGLGLLLRCHRLAAGRSGAQMRVRGAGENIRNVVRLAKVESLIIMETASNAD